MSVAKFKGTSIIGLVVALLLLGIGIAVNLLPLPNTSIWRVLFGVSTLNFTLRATVPLALGAMAGILCERTGIINIGIEGMMLAGAFAGFVVKVGTNDWPLMLSLLAGVTAALAAGALMGFIHALFSIKFKMDQIISGTFLIILALGLTSYLFNPDWVAEGKFSPIRIPLLADIPVIGEVFFDNPPITYTALILVALLHVGLFHTKWGLRSRAAGEHPRAADTLGVDVNFYRYLNTTLGGMVAGLAGGFLVLEAVGQFQEGMTAGRGFISLAAMIFGNWMPFGALGAASLFGYTQGVQNALLLAGVVNIPRHFISMLPYVVTVVVVAGFVGRVRPPAAEGKVYETEASLE
ncbi:MAG: ABC transporter permease [Caldilineae bacterium]|nr:MAG: ABC transporter permease [Caldilineae bacterium]